MQRLHTAIPYMVLGIKMMTKNSPYCFLDLYNGETGAFRCLAAGKGEVAFIELNTIKENTGNSKSEISSLSYYLLDFYLI
jgi:tellurite resistance-related uncharacterized protein